MSVAILAQVPLACCTRKLHHGAMSKLRRFAKATEDQGATTFGYVALGLHAATSETKLAKFYVDRLTGTKLFLCTTYLLGACLDTLSNKPCAILRSARKGVATLCNKLGIDCDRHVDAKRCMCTAAGGFCIMFGSIGHSQPDAVKEARVQRICELWNATVGALAESEISLTIGGELEAVPLAYGCLNLQTLVEMDERLEASGLLSKWPARFLTTAPPSTACVSLPILIGAFILDVRFRGEACVQALLPQLMRQAAGLLESTVLTQSLQLVQTARSAGLSGVVFVWG
jgi:hypothetical protein